MDSAIFQGLCSPPLFTLARVCVFALATKGKSYDNKEGGGGGDTPKKRSLVRALPVDFKVVFWGWLCRASAKQTTNRSTHACDQHYSCSENKQTQQQGKELKEGAGGKADDLFFWHVQRGWRWISCIYSVKRGKKRRQKSKASFIAPEKTKIFNKLPIATPSLEKGGEEKNKLQVFARGLYRSHAGN